MPPNDRRRPMPFDLPTQAATQAFAADVESLRTALVR